MATLEKDCEGLEQTLLRVQPGVTSTTCLLSLCTPLSGDCLTLLFMKLPRMSLLVNNRDVFYFFNSQMSLFMDLFNENFLSSSPSYHSFYFSQILLQKWQKLLTSVMCFFLKHS